MTSISIRGVSKIFPTARGQHIALSGVDLDIAPGEFVSFIGHSGCGKSTLLNMVAGLSRATEGDLLIDGAPVQGPGLDRAMVFQNYSLLPWLSVRQNVFEAVDAARPSQSREEKMASVEHFLAAVKLTAHADKKPAQLSGGMKQRVAIARAFAVHPKILILDEPFGALDALTKGKLHDTLLGLWKDAASRVETVLMVTHDIDEAIYLSDRVVVMSNGPSAKIAEVMEVDIPRPRDKRAMNGLREYAALKARLIEKLSAGHANAARAPRDSRRLRLGFVPLLDSAPLVMAHELGFWKKQGLDVELWKQPSWAAVRDKVLGGELNAAHCLFSLGLSVKCGISEPRGATLPLAMSLSSNAQAIALHPRLELASGDLSGLKAALGRIVEEEKRPPTFAMTYSGGTHDIWLRALLLDAGVELSSVRIITLPPPQMVAEMEKGGLDGFCAGEPWPWLAASRGAASLFMLSGQMWPDHPEKALAVNPAWALEKRDDLRRVLDALLEACMWLSREENLAQAAQIMGGEPYLAAPPASLEALLRGQVDGQVLEHAAPRFFNNTMNFPRRAHAAWFLSQFERCGLLSSNSVPVDVASVVRECVLPGPFREVARARGLPPCDDGAPFKALGRMFEPAQVLAGAGHQDVVLAPQAARQLEEVA